MDLRDQDLLPGGEFAVVVDRHHEGRAKTTVLHLKHAAAVVRADAEPGRGVAAVGSVFATIGGAHVIDPLPDGIGAVPGSPALDGHLRHRRDDAVGQVDVVAGRGTGGVLRTGVGQGGLAAGDRCIAGAVHQRGIGPADHVRDRHAIGALIEGPAVNQTRLHVEEHHRRRGRAVLIGHDAVVIPLVVDGCAGDIECCLNALGQRNIMQLKAHHDDRLSVPLVAQFRRNDTGGLADQLGITTGGDGITLDRSDNRATVLRGEAPDTACFSVGVNTPVVSGLELEARRQTAGIDRRVGDAFGNRCQRGRIGAEVHGIRGRLDCGRSAPGQHRIDNSGSAVSRARLVGLARMGRVGH